MILFDTYYIDTSVHILMLHIQTVNPHLKLACTIDALYGPGVAEYMPEPLSFQYSRTGRIRAVYHKDALLCTPRVDGGLALSVYMAQALLCSRQFVQSCVEVSPEAAPFVEEGRSVFARHVVWCGSNVRIGSDTPAIHTGKVIAVGKAVLSAGMMAGCTRGVAVNIRKGLKGREADNRI